MRKETFPSLDSRQNNRSPLQVSSEVPPGLDMDEAVRLVAQMNITVAELIGGVELPKAPISRKYVYGQLLVDDEKLREMPTMLWKFHEWYLRTSKRGEQTMLVAKVAPEYYFREDEIHIDFSEFFQFMNLYALDKSLMSCYCL
jgi:hypothetical protein